MAKNIGKDRIAQKASDFIPEAPSINTNSDKGRTNKVNVGIINTSRGYRLPAVPRQLRIILIALLFIVASVLALLLVGTPAQRENRKTQASYSAADSEIKLANDAVARSDSKQALYHAKLAVKASPNYLDALLLAADLASKQNPADAMVLYGRALKEFKEQNNFNAGKQNVVQYSAAAGLAENAGNKAEALKYYKAVVDNADKSNSYEKDLMRQASESIERLK